MPTVTAQSAQPSTTRTVLVTGANKGLGRETARRLIADGHTVYIGSRDAERGRRAADELGARLVVLDVTDEESVRSAAMRLSEEIGHLDVLVNNAGITGDPMKPAEQQTAEDVAEVYATNVLGTVRVVHALLPLLRAAPAPVVVNVSSGTGSFHRTTDPDAFEATWPALAYASSKAALNMLTVQYAKSLPELRINAVDPGYTATDATGGQGQNLTQGTDAIVAMTRVSPDGPTGTFTDASGTVPW